MASSRLRPNAIWAICIALATMSGRYRIHYISALSRSAAATYKYFVIQYDVAKELRENRYIGVSTMSLLSKTAIAIGLVFSLSGAAYASDASELNLASGQAMFISMDGKAMRGPMKSPTAAMMARAQVVPPGTIFFMNEGKLMMVFDRSEIGIMLK